MHIGGDNVTIGATGIANHDARVGLTENRDFIGAIFSSGGFGTAIATADATVTVMMTGVMVDSGRGHNNMVGLTVEIRLGGVAVTVVDLTLLNWCWIWTAQLRHIE